jgi:hypothetical protein
LKGHADAWPFSLLLPNADWLATPPLAMMIARGDLGGGSIGGTPVLILVEVSDPQISD